MPLEIYISELLYRYDCVIVPEFGAFLTKRISAQIDPSSYFLSPPKKVLSFNAQLQHNDGLLCNYVAEIEKVPYSQAIKIVHEKAEEFKKILASTGTLQFKYVGELLLSSEGVLSFNPNRNINYLTTSFGLEGLKAPSIKREAHKQIVASVEEETPITVTPESRANRRWLRYAAAAILLVGLSGLGAVKLYESGVTQHNLMVQEEAAKAIESKVQEATFIIPTPLPSAKLVVEKQSGRFHIVAGAFRVEANSDKKVSQLKALGYKARKIEGNKYGLHEVVYSSYKTRDEAQKALYNIRANHNPEAWLLIRNLN